MHLDHPDRLIAKRLLKGDETAFRQLFDSYFPRLYRFALAWLDGNAEESREAVQQTFCKAFEGLERYRGEASLYGWMCQILRNTIIDAERRSRRERATTRYTESDEAVQALVDLIRAPAEDEPEYQASRADLAILIQATLDCLPAHYGDALEWKYVDELSVKEIAQRLAIGSKAAESLLARARNAFREAISSVNDSAELFAKEMRAPVEGPHDR